MANTLAYSDSQHTFADIFNSTFKSGEEDVLLTSIVIPKIQRDYAQGRSTLEAVRVRNKFLDALYDAVEGTPITLDFVYGNIDKNGVLTPLDGQQRLTTLFLLHWFAAKKEHIQESEYLFLRGFLTRTGQPPEIFATSYFRLRHRSRLASHQRLSTKIGSRLTGSKTLRLIRC